MPRHRHRFAGHILITGWSLDLSRGFATLGGTGSRTQSAVPPRPITTELPKALIIATEHWPAITRLCLALAETGFVSIGAVAPAGHAMLNLVRLGASFTCNPYSGSADTLRDAIAAWPPDIVVPCDERALAWLRELYSRAAAGQGRSWRAIKPLIERSLGDPAGLDIAARKTAFIAEARHAGIAVPDTAVVGDVAELRARLADLPFPCVLKADGSYGGLAVRIVYGVLDAEQAFAALTAPPGWAGAIRRAVENATLRPLIRRANVLPPTVALQQYIHGRPANRAVACWDGEVLAGISVAVLATVHETGPATVVEVIAHDEVSAVAAQLVRRFKLSGFYGFDFVLEHATGRAVLLEMNARPTQTCHLALDVESDLVGALAAKLAGTAPRPVMPAARRGPLAFFPQELWRDPASAYLHAAYHDVPWRHPAFIAAYLTPPQPGWTDAVVKALKSLRRPRGVAALSEPQGAPLPSTEGGG